MSEVIATGYWRPNEGQDEQFIEAWTEFATWASRMSGAGWFRLLRDTRDKGAFVSFSSWDSFDSMHAWKGSEEFKPNMARLQQFVDVFKPTELDVVRMIEASAEVGA